MSSEVNQLQCYNRACGQLFDPETNNEDSCQYHPGVPVFHDAYKKWSCCDKKTTDFTEFLNIKGCANSYHSNVKPPEPKKPSKEVMEEEAPPVRKPLQQQQNRVRPDVNEPMEHIQSKIGTSLKPLLEKTLKEMALETEKINDGEIQLNTPCHNKGCREVYKGEYSNIETCMYHSGIPVFHEGMKYWSCCVKRTTDFDSFLEQVGCTTGKHKWHKDITTESQAKCRYDWHQTAQSVIISVYSKCPLPELSYVEANPVKLHMHIAFGKEKQIFEEEVILFGVVDVKGSTVTYLGSKVEIILKKAESQSWKDLRLRETIPNFNNMSLDDDNK
ncbi:cysteine and histidine-rich domain-containing protein 1 [Parasteatoda tepidariorum]|uniref:Cysteine and histidine-rich domain-containing protein 1 n=1 Tax=Parasteatoda tepidariorum TaxID=114398 RepID=A0A2L2Y408_PARTP|nr:cysteine and histidine-rich domain-containing protein 1 [Parasteatoda tepidariorum]